jgi:hypothetical protein
MFVICPLKYKMVEQIRRIHYFSFGLIEHYALLKQEKTIPLAFQ